MLRHDFKGSAKRVASDREPIPFSQVNRRGRPGHDPAMQRHHLLPLQLLRERWFGFMFGRIGRVHMGFDDFRANGMLLPATEKASLRIGLPLHRGPHRNYNQMVIERVGQIEKSWAKQHISDPEAALDEAMFRLGLLQDALRKRLLTERRRLVLNKKDPLGAGFDFRELDAMAEELWKVRVDPPSS